MGSLVAIDDDEMCVLFCSFLSCLCSLPVQVQRPVLRLPHLSTASPALPGAHEHNDAG